MTAGSAQIASPRPLILKFFNHPSPLMEEAPAATIAAVQDFLAAH
jgi:hypothetical protein